MQVEMVGLVGVGLEFVEIEDLVPYLRQFSPVDYSDRFSFADRIRSFCASIGDPTGVIEVETRFKRERRQILKGYDDAAPTGGKASKVYDIELLSSPDLGWHGWIGHSTFEGELTDNTVAGVRFRVKNIQVGSSDIIEDLAAGLTAGRTERRLQRWAVGEVFITNPSVVPNARRDGFEDSKDWREIKEDIRKRVAKRVVTLVRNASKSRSALKTISNEIAALQRRVEAGQGDEVALQALITTSERLLSKLASDKLSGVDPKEVGEFVAKVKGLKEVLVEALSKLRKQESEPDAETEPDDEPEADGDQEEAEGSGSDQEEDADDDEDAEAWSAEQLVDALIEVIAKEYGQPEADRLLGLARESLSD
jgi:molecular chaperone HtpG